MGVEYADGSAEQWPARIVATDAQHDLAVLAIDAPPERLRPIRVRACEGTEEDVALHWWKQYVDACAAGVLSASAAYPRHRCVAWWVTS